MEMFKVRLVDRLGRATESPLSEREYNGRRSDDDSVDELGSVLPHSHSLSAMAFLAVTRSGFVCY
jgi:hypothetical protein